MFEQMFLFQKDLPLTLIALETQGWQELLRRDINRLEAQKSIRLKLTGIKNFTSKEGRIRSLQPLWENGYLQLIELDETDIYHDDIQELIDQFLGADEPAVNDDGPDATEMMIRIADRGGRKISKAKTW